MEEAIAVSTPQQQSSIFRVLGKRGAEGAGFLISNRHGITCFHVVNAALGRSIDNELPLGESIPCQFPFVDDAPVLQAKVVKRSKRYDTACLVFPTEIRGAAPARLVPFDNRFIAKEVWAFGFPSTHPDGVNANGVVANILPRGAIQVDFTGSGQNITQGFSGAPVVTKEQDFVIGMVLGADATGKSASAGSTSGEAMLQGVSLTEIYESEQNSTPVNWVKGRLLPQLVTDLDQLEYSGLVEDGWCKEIQRALSMLYDHSPLFGDASGWDEVLVEFMRDYYKIYREWNDQHGTDEHARLKRRELVEALRRSREEKIKKGLTWVALRATDRDVTLCDAIYRQFDRALRSVHSKARRRLFPNTKDALAEYKRYRRFRSAA
jgi:hypothetical protein